MNKINATEGSACYKCGELEYILNLFKLLSISFGNGIVWIL